MNITGASCASSSNDAVYARELRAAAHAFERSDAIEAAKSLGALSKAYPAQPEVLRLAAIWYGLREMRDEALRAIRQALAGRPRDPLYHNTLATVLANAGRFADALATLYAACDLNPGLSISWYNLGIMLNRDVRLDEAAHAFKRALSIDQHYSAAPPQPSTSPSRTGRAPTHPVRDGTITPNLHF